MRKFAASLLCFVALLFASVGCDVHEFPAPPKEYGLQLQLQFETDLPLWEHEYTKGHKVISKADVPVDDALLKTIFKSVQSSGQMRYIVRFYPKLAPDQRQVDKPRYEFVFTRDLSGGYDATFDLNIAAGEYTIMVWAELSEDGKNYLFYNSAKFDDIMLNTPYHGCDDYKDAFRGVSDDVLVKESIRVQEGPQVIKVNMQRPLAKFGLVTTDLADFIDRETKALMLRNAEAQQDDAQTKTDTKVDINDYRIMCGYAGFMPNTYNMVTDKATDSAKGVIFECKLTPISQSEALLGSDYVFISDKETSVSVQFGIYDASGKQVSITSVIEIPIKRSFYTLLRGSFLTQASTGGLTIMPDFDDEFNIYVK